MRIVVLLKQVPDTWGTRRLDVSTGRLDRRTGDQVADEIGERALEVALRQQEADPGGTEVVVVSMGPESAREVVRKGLAMGADRGVHILDDALVGADLGRTARVLAAALGRIGFDLVIAGNESTDGRGGVVPAMVAEHLDVPHVTYLDAVVVEDGRVRGERGGSAGTLTLVAELPAVVSVTERAAEARFPGFRGIMRAKKKPFEVLTAADLGLGQPGAASVVTELRPRAGRSAGRKVVDRGDAEVEVLDLLTSRGLLG